MPVYGLPRLWQGSPDTPLQEGRRNVHETDKLSSVDKVSDLVSWLRLPLWLGGAAWPYPLASQL